MMVPLVGPQRHSRQWDSPCCPDENGNVFAWSTQTELWHGQGGCGWEERGGGEERGRTMLKINPMRWFRDGKVYTVVSRKSTHGQCTWHGHQKGSWHSCVSALSIKVHPCLRSHLPLSITAVVCCYISGKMPEYSLKHSSYIWSTHSAHDWPNCKGFTGSSLPTMKAKLQLCCIFQHFSAL